MYPSEQLSAQRFLDAIVESIIEFAQQFSDLWIFAADIQLECLEIRGVATDQRIAPSFGARKQTFCAQVVGTQPGERCSNGLRIDPPHQLANQLFLTPQRAARLHALRIANCPVKLLIEREFLALVVGQVDQSFAQFLESGLLALARAFAGL